MKDLKPIKIVNTDGQELEIKVITVVESKDKSKQFLIYTFDDKKENVDLYASIIIEKDNNYELDVITDQEDWDLVQKVIQELAE